jgi:hypothetical protein
MIHSFALLNQMIHSVMNTQTCTYITNMHICTNIHKFATKQNGKKKIDNLVIWDIIVDMIDIRYTELLPPS